MSIGLYYDSGAGGVPADVWGSYTSGSALTPAARELVLAITPLADPEDTWNLAGWACVVADDGGTPFLGRVVAIPALSVGSDIIYTVLDVTGITRTGSSLPSVRGVYWNINRWIGQSRVRFGYRSV